MNTAYKDFSVHHISTGLIKNLVSTKSREGRDFQISLLVMKMFESSDPDVQSELGDCYYRGDGVSQNIDKALALFNSAAKRGSIRAQYDLAWYYYEQDEYLRAIECFNVCIKHRGEFDEHQLGKCHALLGDSYLRLSKPEIHIAIENLSVAAEKYRDAFASRRLAQTYSKSNEDYFDRVKSIKYYELAILLRDSISAHELATNYIYGDDNLQIEPDGQKAEDILLPFACSGDYCIVRDLGLLYLRGDSKKGISADLHKAKTYFEQAWSLEQEPLVAGILGSVYFRHSEYEAAEKMLIMADTDGYSGYSDLLGNIYQKGLLGTKDRNKAAYYYGRAFENGCISNVHSYIHYIELLMEFGNYQKAFDVAEEGEKLFKDIFFVFIKANLAISNKVIGKISPDDAAKMMELCIDYHMCVLDAHMALGNYYLSVKEYRKSEKHYIEAFNNGVADAAVYLGRIYEKGGGTVKADIYKAYDYYEKAAAAGSDLGKEEISCFKISLFGGFKRIRNI